MTLSDKHRQAIIDTLEDFAENLASASEEDSFAKLNEVVTESVNDAATALLALLSQVERDSRIDENKQWLEFDHELMGEVSKRIAKLQSLEPGREATDGRN